MFIFKRVKELQQFLSRYKGVAFVPTMGALHEGHLSLIKRAKQLGQITVASIFVNPTQFNDAKDLEKYPRTTAEDIKLLESVGCDVLFLPEVKDVYPEDYSFEQSFDFGAMAEVMEGAKRPGHFEGVVEVVYRLLDIVQPDYLVMGQKDFQQFSIIMSMLEQMVGKTKLIVGATKREDSGLAMSSRNTRLEPALSTEALLLSKTLFELKSELSHKPIDVLLENARKQFDVNGVNLEYLEIVDGRTLQPILDTKDSDIVVACVAAYVGDIRLIDNIILKGEELVFG